MKLDSDRAVNLNTQAVKAKQRPVCTFKSEMEENIKNGHSDKLDKFLAFVSVCK